MCQLAAVFGRGIDTSTGRAPRIILEGDELLIRLGGKNYQALGQSLAFVEATLSIGADAYCGRFEFAKISSITSLSRGPSQRCLLPLPNFVVVVLDDVRFDGIDGMPTLLDRVAAEGASYDNAFTPYSSCASSRASILTGLYALRHGTMQVSGPIGGAHRFRELGADQQTIATWLTSAGYRTAFFGKYINAYSVTEQNKGPGGTFYLPPGWDRWWAFVSPEHYGGVFGSSYQIVDENAVLTDYTDHSTDAEYSTDLSAEQLRSFVSDAVSEGRPFFAYWAPYAAHADPIVATPAERHDGAFADLAPWRPASWNEADVSDKPRWVQSIQQRLNAPGSNGALIRAITDVHRIKQYETLLAVDEQISQLLDQLQVLGVDQDTMILVISDNGIGWGEHQMWGGKGCPMRNASVSF